MSAPNGSRAGASASGQKPLPLYYAGIPKDLGKKREPPKEIIPKLDAFGAKILANFERSKNLAIQRRKAQEKRVAEAKTAEEARHKAMLQRQAQEEVTQSLRKALGKSSGGGNQLRNRLSGGSSSRRGVTKSRSSRANGSGSRRRASKRPDEGSDDDGYGGHNISRKGMERVVMKRKPKAPVARASTTSDYSDMFGDQYLVGADIDATKDLAKASKGDLERARAAKRKKQEEYAKKKKEADAFDAIKMRMERTGEAKTRAGKQKLRELREELQSDTFVRVGEPAMGSNMDGQNNFSRGGNGKKGVRKEVLLGNNERMKQALKDRLKNWGHDTSQKFESPAPSSGGASRRDDRNDRRDARDRRYSYPPPRPAAKKRKHVVDSDESDDEDDYYQRDSRDSRVNHRSRPPLQKRSRRPSGSAGRNRRTRYESDSEEEEDYEDERRGGGFLTSFTELEEEEEASAAAGRAEDRKEKRALQKHARDKAARRRAAGIYSDDEDDD